MQQASGSSMGAADGPAAECDVLVIGSGAGGMATALAARLQGLDVQVLEKAPLLGGGTALSYGTLWVPCNPVAARAGLKDDRAQARRYLEREMGRRFDATLVDAYLEHAPRVIDWFERHTDLAFDCREDYPDYHSYAPGASAGGRTIFVAPFDGRELGADIARLRPPLPAQTVLGMMYTPKEVQHLQRWAQSWASFRHVAGRFGRHLADLARYRRTMVLTNGNAMAARMLKTALRLGIPLHAGVALAGLVIEDGVVVGARVRQDGRERALRARVGVVLACGGFPHDAARCAALFDRPHLDGQDWSLAPPTNTGDGLAAAEAVGAVVQGDVANAGFWSPVSRVPHRGGILVGHFHERQRPGFIVVGRDGRRFANEALSYHHFGSAINRATPPGRSPEAFLVCDHRSLRRTGMGNAVLPAPFPLGAHLRAGYLQRGATLQELATRCGIDAQALVQEVETFNHYARDGRDPAFGKGASLYDRYFAVPGRVNGNVGPLERGPFYAVRISSAHMATLAGLKADVGGSVLNAAGVPIPGLYAAGGDRLNVFAGSCPGGGITLGPALTFGYLTGLQLAREAGRGTAAPREQRAAEVLAA